MELVFMDSISDDTVIKDSSHTRYKSRGLCLFRPYQKTRGKFLRKITVILTVRETLARGKNVSL